MINTVALVSNTNWVRRNHVDYHQVIELLQLKDGSVPIEVGDPDHMPTLSEMDDSRLARLAMRHNQLDHVNELSDREWRVVSSCDL